MYPKTAIPIEPIYKDDAGAPMQKVREILAEPTLELEYEK